MDFACSQSVITSFHRVSRFVLSSGVQSVWNSRSTEVHMTRQSSICALQRRIPNFRVVESKIDTETARQAPEVFSGFPCPGTVRVARIDPTIVLFWAVDVI